MRPGKRERQAIRERKHADSAARQRASQVTSTPIHTSSSLLMSRAAANAPFARPMNTFDGTMRVKRLVFHRFGQK